MPYYKLLKKYLKEGQEPVVPDVSEFAKHNIQVIAEDLIGEDDNFIKHSPEKLAEVLKRLFTETVNLSVKTP
jgi:hypothetical protein